MPASIRIVARPNAVGIARDIRILTDSISEWQSRPAFSHHREISPFRRLVDRCRPEDCMIFLERVKTRWLRRARQFILIPNQERYATRLVGVLRRVHHVLTKTRHAQELFARHHPSVHHIGFTSIDRRLPEARPAYQRFLHLAGGSALKGTATLIDVWAKHPEWPTLTVLYHRPDAIGRMPSNVTLIRRYLPDAELRTVQNECGVQICPSSSEGWGHSIVEGMSCGAVVVTTDGPPMNEIIRPERGVLVPAAGESPRKLGTDYHVDALALEAGVQRIIDMAYSEKAEIGQRARAWFEENDRAFRGRLRAVMDEILADR